MNMEFVACEIFRSGVILDYSEKFVEDCYIDAYSEFAKDKSFCIELCTVEKTRFQLLKHRCPYVEIGFQCVVRVFESPDKMLDFINKFGEEKLSEIYYSSI